MYIRKSKLIDTKIGNSNVGTPMDVKINNDSVNWLMNINIIY